MSLSYPIKVVALSAALLAAPNAAAETVYKAASETGGEASVFLTLEQAYDAVSLIRAGSFLAAAERLRCFVKNGERLEVVDSSDRVFLRVLVPSGDSAGCKGYMPRSQISKTDTNTGKIVRVR